MADLGHAYVQIIPEAKGIANKIGDLITPGSNAAGEKAGKGIAGGITSALGGLGKKLFLGVGAGAAAVAAGSLKAFNEVHAGVENIITATGASGAALEGMQQSMNNLATSIPTDFATAGAAIGEVKTRFNLTGQELEDLSAKFVKFADLNGTDVVSSVDTVQAAMAAFGLEASDAGNFLDTLNAAGQATGVSVEQLANDMMTNAASLKEMGYNASDAAAFISNLNKSGIDTSSVMTGMKRALANAAQDGLTMSEAMEQLQGSIQNAQSDTEAYQVAMELFGTRAGGAIADAVRDGRLSFEELGTSITDAAGSIDSTFEATLTPMDRFKTTMNELKIVGANLANGIFDKLGPVFDNLKIIWDGISPTLKTLWEALKTLGTAFGNMVADLMGVDSAAEGTQKAIEVLNKVITGIATAVQWVAENVIPVLQSIIEGIIEFVKEMVDGIKSMIDQFVQIGSDLAGKAAEVWNGIKTAVEGVINGIKTFFTTAWNGIKTTVTTIWNGLKTTASTVWNGIKTAVMTPINAVKTLLSGAWNGIKTTATTGWNGIKTAITKPIETAKATLTGIIEKIKGFFPLNLGNIFNLRIPHISLTGGVAPFGIGGKGSLPKFSVTWAAKGMVVDGASIIGIGEAGKEAAIPLEGRHMRPFAQAIAEEMPGGGGITVNLNYDASDDAQDMLRDLARGIKRYRMAGAF